MEPHNPYTAEHKIKLSDGVERTLRFDTNAIVLLEQSTGLEFAQLLLIPGSFRNLRAALYAGLLRDAEKRREAWGLEKAGELLDPQRFPEVQKLVREALNEAVLGPAAEQKSPEPPASGSAATAKPRPGRGKKR